MKALIFFLSFVNLIGYGQSSIEGEAHFNVSVGTPYAFVEGRSKEHLSLEDGSVITLTLEEDFVTLQKFDASQMQEVARNTPIVT